MKTTVGATRFPLRKTPSSTDHFLDIFTPSQPETLTAQNDNDNEINEDDVFWTGDFSQSSQNHHSTTTNLHHTTSKFSILAKKSGILAALPENNRFNDRSVFNHKAAEVKMSRMNMMIPLAPKQNSNSNSSPAKSAPVNVPLLLKRRETREFDDIDDETETLGDGENEMMPPHEMVAAKESPMLANSVLEGFGRTLKGRDLRQVRNAVWRKTGFLD